MTKEELIEKIEGKTFRLESQEQADMCYKVSKDTIDWFDNRPTEFTSWKYFYYKKFNGLACGCHPEDDCGANEFIDLFKSPKKKRGPKLNKREKLEARLSQVEETTKKAFTCICDKEGYELGEFRSGKYTSTFDMTPEQAVQFAKWVLDLEGK